MYLLDTQIICALQLPKPNEAVTAWLRSVPEHKLYLSASSLGVLQETIETIKTTNRQEAQRAQQWLNRLGSNSQVVSLDAATLQLAAVLQHDQTQLAWDDAVIAGLAFYHRLVVVSQRSDVFLGLKKLKLDVFDPKGWSDEILLNGLEVGT